MVGPAMVATMPKLPEGMLPLGLLNTRRCSISSAQTKDNLIRTVRVRRINKNPGAIDSGTFLLPGRNLPLQMRTAVIRPLVFLTLALRTGHSSFHGASRLPVPRGPQQTSTILKIRGSMLCPNASYAPALAV